MPSQPLDKNQIKELNRSLELPPQPSRELHGCNEALGQIDNTNPFLAPNVRECDGPLLNPNWEEAKKVIKAYADLLGRMNQHIPEHNSHIAKNKSFFRVVTVEPNKDNIWTLVLRTVHLHGNQPIASLDYVKTSCPPVDTTHPIPEDMEKCKNKKCGKFGDEIMSCAACHRAKYCSKSCQKYDWNHGHRTSL